MAGLPAKVLAGETAAETRVGWCRKRADHEYPNRPRVIVTRFGHTQQSHACQASLRPHPEQSSRRPRPVLAGRDATQAVPIHAPGLGGGGAMVARSAEATGGLIAAPDSLRPQCDGKRDGRQARQSSDARRPGLHSTGCLSENAHEPQACRGASLLAALAVVKVTTPAISACWQGRKFWIASDPSGKIYPARYAISPKVAASRAIRRDLSGPTQAR
jgi:hypothetical protein